MSYTFTVEHNGQAYYSGGSRPTRTEAREQLDQWIGTATRAGWRLVEDRRPDFARLQYPEPTRLDLEDERIRTLRVERDPEEEDLPTTPGDCPDCRARIHPDRPHYCDDPNF